MRYTYGFDAVAPTELAGLLGAVGWGTHSLEDLAQSVSAYPCVVHARSELGELVGYLSAFSNGVLTTMFGELLVHPQHRRRGIASHMMGLVKARYPHAPAFVKALRDARHFFSAQGFKVPSAEMTVMFWKPTLPQAD